MMRLAPLEATEIPQPATQDVEPTDDHLVAETQEPATDLEELSRGTVQEKTERLQAMHKRNRLVRQATKNLERHTKPDMFKNLWDYAPDDFLSDWAEYLMKPRFLKSALNDRLDGILSVLAHIPQGERDALIAGLDPDTMERLTTAAGEQSSEPTPESGNMSAKEYRQKRKEAREDGVERSDGEWATKDNSIGLKVDLDHFGGMLAAQGMELQETKGNLGNKIRLGSQKYDSNGDGKINRKDKRRATVEVPDLRIDRIQAGEITVGGAQVKNMVAMVDHTKITVDLDSFALQDLHMSSKTDQETMEVALDALVVSALHLLIDGDGMPDEPDPDAAGELIAGTLTDAVESMGNSLPAGSKPESLGGAMAAAMGAMATNATIGSVDLRGLDYTSTADGETTRASIDKMDLDGIQIATRKGKVSARLRAEAQAAYDAANRIESSLADMPTPGADYAVLSKKMSMQRTRADALSDQATKLEAKDTELASLRQREALGATTGAENERIRDLEAETEEILVGASALGVSLEGEMDGASFSAGASNLQVVATGISLEEGSNTRAVDQMLSDAGHSVEEREALASPEMGILMRAEDVSGSFSGYESGTGAEHTTADAKAAIGSLDMAYGGGWFDVNASDAMLHADTTVGGEAQVIDGSIGDMSFGMGPGDEKLFSVSDASLTAAGTKDGQTGAGTASISSFQYAGDSDGDAMLAQGMHANDFALKGSVEGTSVDATLGSLNMEQAAYSSSKTSTTASMKGFDADDIGFKASGKDFRADMSMNDLKVGAIDYQEDITKAGGKTTAHTQASMSGASIGSLKASGSSGETSGALEINNLAFKNGSDNLSMDATQVTTGSGDATKVLEDKTTLSSSGLSVDAIKASSGKESVDIAGLDVGPGSVTLDGISGDLSASLESLHVDKTTGTLAGTSLDIRSLYAQGVVFQGQGDNWYAKVQGAGARRIKVSNADMDVFVKNVNVHGIHAQSEDGAVSGGVRAASVERVDATMGSTKIAVDDTKLKRTEGGITQGGTIHGNTDGLSVGAVSYKDGDTEASAKGLKVGPSKAHMTKGGDAAAEVTGVGMDSFKAKSGDMTASGTGFAIDRVAGSKTGDDVHGELDGMKLASANVNMPGSSTSLGGAYVDGASLDGTITDDGLDITKAGVEGVGFDSLTGSLILPPEDKTKAEGAAADSGSSGGGLSGDISLGLLDTLDFHVNADMPFQFSMPDPSAVGKDVVGTLAEWITFGYYEHDMDGVDKSIDVNATLTAKLKLSNGALDFDGTGVELKLSDSNLSLLNVDLGDVAESAKTLIDIGVAGGAAAMGPAGNATLVLTGAWSKVMDSIADLKDYLRTERAGKDIAGVAKKHLEDAIKEALSADPVETESGDPVPLTGLNITSRAQLNKSSNNIAGIKFETPGQVAGQDPTNVITASADPFGDKAVEGTEDYFGANFGHTNGTDENVQADLGMDNMDIRNISTEMGGAKIGADKLTMDDVAVHYEEMADGSKKLVYTLKGVGVSGASYNTGG